MPFGDGKGSDYWSNSCWYGDGREDYWSLSPFYRGKKRSKR